MIALGYEVKDRITGFAGVVTGRAEYISGCTQCLVAPPVSNDGAFRQGEWFDEQRLDVTNAKAMKLSNGKTPGHDRQAPKR